LYRVIIVLVCIGCGAVSTPQPCLGTCIDRRLDLVRADQHAAAVAALTALEAALAERRTLVERLARSAPAEAEWEPLRARARASLRGEGAPDPGDVITTWACDSCGRIEAPQPCIGVCIRPETPMVTAAEHADVLEQAGAVAHELERLAPPVRQLAWVTPRSGRLAEAASAVQAAAQARLTPEPPRSDTQP
jgi:hypothetical protein